MKLFVAILNYKQPDLTIDCLRSLAPEVTRLGEIKVGVCENGSEDGSTEKIAAAIAENGWGEWAELTPVTPNRGFTGGNNVVIEPALKQYPDMPYVLLLNNDTLIRENALGALIDFMDANPKVGLAGSRLEDPDGTPQVSAFRFMGLASEFDRGLRLGAVSKLLDSRLVRMPVPTEDVEVPWVAGASLIIRRDVIDAIGLLDEGFFTYYDDIDYCLNAKRAGWPTWYVPESRVVHLIGQTTGVTNRDDAVRAKRRAAYWFEARRRYFTKNHGGFYAALADASFLSGCFLCRLRQIISRKQINDPEQLFRDSVRQSVFLKGPGVPVVQNPALAKK